MPVLAGGQGGKAGLGEQPQFWSVLPCTVPGYFYMGFSQRFWLQVHAARFSRDLVVLCRAETKVAENQLSFCALTTGGKGGNWLFLGRNAAALP